MSERVRTSPNFPQSIQQGICSPGCPGCMAQHWNHCRKPFVSHVFLVHFEDRCAWQVPTRQAPYQNRSEKPKPRAPMWHWTIKGTASLRKACNKNRAYLGDACECTTYQVTVLYQRTMEEGNKWVEQNTWVKGPVPFSNQLPSISSSLIAKNEGESAVRPETKAQTSRLFKE